MKLSKILVGATAGAAILVAAQAQAESPLTANVGVTSNYIWRGVTQSNDRSAVSGGIDYAHSSGISVGTWVSNLDGGQYEQDLYAGYSFSAGPVGLDVGYISYMYPVGTAQLDFAEAYVNASYKMFGLGVAYTTSKEGNPANKNDMYAYIKADFEVKKDLTLGLLAGKYNYDDPATTDYTHYKVSLSKDDFSFAYEKTNYSGSAGDPRFTVSWSKSFDL